METMGGRVSDRHAVRGRMRRGGACAGVLAGALLLCAAAAEADVAVPPSSPTDGIPSAAAISQQYQDAVATTEADAEGGGGAAPAAQPAAPVAQPESPAPQPAPASAAQPPSDSGVTVNPSAHQEYHPEDQQYQSDTPTVHAGEAEAPPVAESAPEDAAAEPAAAAPAADASSSEPAGAPAETEAETAPAETPIEPTQASAPSATGDTLVPLQQPLAAAGASQSQPTNINVSIDIFSGPDGPVTQINQVAANAGGADGGDTIVAPVETAPDGQDAAPADSGSSSPTSAGDLPESWVWTWTWSSGGACASADAPTIDASQGGWEWTWVWGCAPAPPTSAPGLGDPGADAPVGAPLPVSSPPPAPPITAAPPRPAHGGVHTARDGGRHALQLSVWPPAGIRHTDAATLAPLWYQPRYRAAPVLDTAVRRVPPAHPRLRGAAPKRPDPVQLLLQAPAGVSAAEGGAGSSGFALALAVLLSALTLLAPHVRRRLVGEPVARPPRSRASRLERPG
jgi:nicotinate-nucleotide--dimethylbenzimidazole phosphoribosyltransferase